MRYDTVPDALYIKLRNTRIEESDEIVEGFIIDYDSKGKPLAIEILDASDIVGSREMKVELAIAENLEVRTKTR